MTNPKDENFAIPFDDITDHLPLHIFEEVKTFILKNGNQQTFRSFDNNNPHYTFEKLDVFLGANLGQGNINNDPAISDFNQLTIADNNNSIQYCLIIAVRKDDLKEKKCWVYPGMEEEKVYLINPYRENTEALRESCVQRVQIIKEKINNFSKE